MQIMQQDAAGKTRTIGVDFIKKSFEKGAMMAIRTRLTDMLSIEHPILSAPMAVVAGGKLAAAVTAAGGLGLIGGGYCDPAWIDNEIEAAGNAKVGMGFITWRLDEDPSVLDRALDHAMPAVMLSFGDERPYAQRIKDAGARLICQVQTVEQARRARDSGADIIIAQGTEAGGHGASRATLPLVPAVVDAVAPTVVLAAGGIADGRGLAAALTLGADGVLMGTRFYGAAESLAPEGGKERLKTASGDQTLRSSVLDVARELDWPKPYALKTLANRFTDTWHGNEAALIENREAAVADYNKAVAAADFDTAAVVVGEAADLITECPPAADIIAATVSSAERILRDARPDIRFV